MLSRLVGVFSTNAGLLDGRSGAGQGFVLGGRGRYALPLQFAVFWGFSDFALKVRGGIGRAEIQLSGMLDGGDGIVFATDEGKRRRIDSVHVTHFSATNVSHDPAQKHSMCCAAACWTVRHAGPS